MRISGVYVRIVLALILIPCLQWAHAQTALTPIRSTRIAAARSAIKPQWVSSDVIGSWAINNNGMARLTLHNIHTGKSQSMPWQIPWRHNDFVLVSPGIKYVLWIDRSQDFYHPEWRVTDVRTGITRNGPKAGAPNSLYAAWLRDGERWVSLDSPQQKLLHVYSAQDLKLTQSIDIPGQPAESGLDRAYGAGATIWTAPDLNHRKTWLRWNGFDPALQPIYAGYIDPESLPYEVMPDWASNYMHFKISPTTQCDLSPIDDSLVCWMVAMDKKPNGPEIQLPNGKPFSKSPDCWYGIYLTDRDGRRARCVGVLAAESKYTDAHDAILELQWCPDGKALMFVYNHQIYMITI